MPRIHLDYAGVQQLPQTFEQTIPPDYLDMMGHMNVMWYTHLFSMGMSGLMMRVGLTEEFLQARDGGTFALESHIRYLSEVRAGQMILVHSRLLGRSEKRYHVMHFMTNKNKLDISATLEMTSSYVDLRKRRTAPLPEIVTDQLDDLLAEHTQLAWEVPTCGVMTC